MGAIAEGALDVGLPLGNTRDEIGQMTKAPGVFRDTAVEMKESNLREITEARRRLTDAIESISEGFVLDDAGGKIVLCNRHYAEVLLGPDLGPHALPGSSFEALMGSCIELDLEAGARGRENDWLAERLAWQRQGSDQQVGRWGERWIKVNEAAQTLLALINDIFDFSKVEAGAMELEEVPVNLVETIETSDDLVTRRASEKGLELVFKLDRKLPYAIFGDTVRTKPILLYLLNSAIKFTDKGEVVLTTTRRFGGTGLGRVIPKRLVRRIGGLISVESESRRGTAFTVTLRFREAETIAAPALDEMLRLVAGHRVLVVDDHKTNLTIQGEPLSGWSITPAPEETPQGGWKRWSEGLAIDAIITDCDMPVMIGLDFAEAVKSALGAKTPPIGLYSSVPLWDDNLLVEDNELNRKICLNVLKHIGFEPTALDDAWDAITTCQTRDFDVVCMDIEMPDMDGVTARAELRQGLPAARQPYIIALTANTMASDRDSYLRAGMDDYPSKPIRMDNLVGCLDRATAQSRAGGIYESSKRQNDPNP